MAGKGGFSRWDGCALAMTAKGLGNEAATGREGVRWHVFVWDSDAPWLWPLDPMLQVGLGWVGCLVGSDCGGLVVLPVGGLRCNGSGWWFAGSGPGLHKSSFLAMPMTTSRGDHGLGIDTLLLALAWGHECAHAARHPPATRRRGAAVCGRFPFFHQHLERRALGGVAMAGRPVSGGECKAPREVSQSASQPVSGHLNVS